MPCICTRLRRRGYNLAIPHKSVRKEQLCSSGKCWGPSNYLYNVLERLYDKCAQYNIRYCPLREVTRKQSFKNTIKNILILICFFVANFVVFINIVLKMISSLYQVVKRTIFFIDRFIVSKRRELPIEPAVTNNNIFFPPQVSK